MNKLVATLPIPEGLEYLPKTVRPAPALASLDGKTFAPMPLKRKVRLADGREVEREVAASEYRFPALDAGLTARRPLPGRAGPRPRGAAHGRGTRRPLMSPSMRDRRVHRPDTNGDGRRPP